MPLIEQRLDTGFTGYRRPEVERPEAPDNSSLAGIGALLRGDTDEFNRITGESAKTIAAGFRMENDVLNMLDLASRPTYKPDPTFDVVARLKADGLWENAADNFLGVVSEAEYLALKARMTREERDRQTLAAAGTAGFVAQMAAGIISPTALLPFVGGLRGIKAVGMGVGMGFAGGAAQEIPLQLAQETRSLEESVSSVAMSTVLGGVLGGAVAYFGRNLDEVGEELVRMERADMAIAPGAGTISRTSPASVGAASAEGPVPELVRMSPLPKFIDPLWDAYITPVTSAVGNLTIPNALNQVPGARRFAGRTLGELTPDLIKRIFPVVYNLSVDSAQARRLTAKLSDSGLEVKGAAVGGTVESRIRTYDFPLAEAKQTLKRLFAEYTFGVEGANKVGAATLAPLLSRGEKMKFDQFRKEIGRAMREGDKHSTPEVQAAAQYLRSEVYTPLFDAAKKEGLFKGIPEELLGDSSYLNRVYDLDLITARKPEFIKKLADHYNAKLVQDFREAAAKLQKATTRLNERAEDFARSSDEITKLREEFEERLSALEEGRGEDLVELEERIADLRADARAAPSGSPERKALNDEADALESEGGAPLAETRAERAEIKRRLKNLNRARATLEKRQEAKLDKIDRAEELSFNTLQRLVRKGQKVLKDIDKVSDARLDDQLKKLTNQFNEAGTRFDKNEQRILEATEDEWWTPQETRAVNEPSPEELKGYVNTRGKGERFHGSPGPVILDVDGHYSTENYYGQGLYSTDAMDVADGYARRGKSTTPHFYKINERNPVVFDMEGPIPDWLIAGEGDFVEMAAEEATSVRGLYDEIRDLSRGEGYSADDVQEIFEVFRQRFEEQGFNTLEHRGGLRTKSPEHNVRIYLNKDAADMVPIEPASYKAGPRGLTKVDALQQRQLGLHSKLEELAERLELADRFDREAAREIITEGLNEATRHAQSIVERRAVRNARLAEQAKDLDPELAAKRIGELKDDIKARTETFREDWRVRGADDLDPVTGQADFREHARELATATTDRILGINMRLPGMDIIMQERGAELARVLDIESNSLVSAEDGLSFLIDDADELVSRYVRTLAPDIELHRAFGDFAPDMGKNLEFKKLNDEYLALLRDTQEQMKAGINPKTGRKVSTPYTQRQIDEASKRITDEQKRVKDNLMAMIDRARYQRGLPKDPAAMSHRLGRAARNLNVTRFMGGVVVSSLPDVGRPILKYGLIRTASQGYIPFIKRLMSGKMLREGMSPRHLRATGSGLDMATQGRLQAIFGTEDYIRGGTMIEKGLEWTANRMGNIAAFAPWTDIGKQIAGSIANARMMDSLAVIAGGEKASARELQEAIDFLAKGGIDDDLALRMWKASQQEGGADLVDGQWWPNTEVWDAEARRAYSAFIYRETANTIITPGIDLPLFMDASPVWRLLTQFKSFGMASTTRGLMAGLQQRDMAFYTGTTISLALGALSYYTYANIVGGRVLEEMQEAFADGSWPEKFADEAINRSGLLGIGAEFQSIGSTIPGLSDKVTLSGERSTRQGANNLFEAVAGPTFGDLANTGAQVATGVYSPTQGTLHQLRTLTPLQNHSLLRGIYDKIEDGIAAKLPEDRR